MKKLLKILGYTVLLLLAIILILGLTQPKDLAIERSIIIKGPQSAVFDQIANFKNWMHWSPWVAKEPSVKITYKGDDGAAGSSYHWLGDETGEGEMSSTQINNGQMNFDLKFIKPWSGKAEGFLKTEVLASGETKVTWNMINHGSFPLNAMNYFMEKIIGSDFENGLDLMKKFVEANPVAGLSMANVQEKEFTSQTYATMRKTLPWLEMQQFSTTAFKQLAEAIGDRMNGTASTFYYTWNDTTQTTDMAPAYPVKGSEPVKGAIMVDIPQTHCCMIVYHGGYAGLGKAHEILGQYINQKSRKLNYVLEEYVSGPFNEPDSTKWVTNINYLVE
jgi:hypothetical protein